MKKLALAALFLSFYFPVVASIIKAPYLQAVKTSDIYVLVECDSANAAAVEYGTDANYGSFASTESTEGPAAGYWVHNIKLTGLQPGTVYHYRVSHDSGAWTGDNAFTTAPLPGASFRLAILGDVRSNPSIHDKIAGHILAANPEVSIYLGDMCDTGSYADWNNEFFVPNQALLSAKVPWFNTIGNHEGWTQATQAYMQNPESSSGNPVYYSFDYGDMHVAVMNNYDAGGYGPGSQQYTWLASDLSISAQKWKIAVSHVHGYGASSGHAPDAIMITDTTDIFEPSGVDMTLAGHSHMYQHNLVNGIHHMIVGGGGAPLHVPTPMPYSVLSAQTYCYALADVGPCSIVYTAYNDDATPIETIEVIKCTETYTPTCTYTETPTLTFSPTGTCSVTGTRTMTFTPTITVSATPRAGGGVLAYPNPFHAASGGSIIFENLPRDSVLVIYNMNGEKVFSESGLTGVYQWDAKNKKREHISRGLYIYTVISGKKTYKGKLAILE